MELKKLIKDSKLFIKKNKRLIKRIAIAMVLLPIFMVLLLFLLVRFQIVTDLPSKADLLAIENPEASELYSNDESLIAKYFIENRTNLEFDDLNPFFIDALIATEDVRFRSHSGVDFRSLMRVFFKSILLRNKSSGGGSTLTQQVVKNVFPRERFRMFSSVLNKFREMIIARKMEKIYTKDEILLLYTNTVSFGERAFGLETASKRFFNKTSKDLLLEEAATLVGILKAPSYYSPRRNPERAQQRRNVVLSQMSKYELLAESTKEQLSKLPLELDYQKSVQKNEFARYFKNQVRKEFEELAKSMSKADGSKYDIYKDGLKVYTSLDLDLQLAAEKNMQKHMHQLQKQFDKSWESGKKFGKGTKIIDEHITKHPAYKSLKKNGASNKEALSAFTTPEEREYWTWKGYQTKNGTRIDSIKHYLSLLHTGVLAVEPATGFVKVWVGGNDYSRFQYDRITEPRQVGSTFKPIVYLTALENGADPCHVYPNELRTYTSYKDWTPKNSSGEYGGELTMVQALINSVNTVSVQVLFEAGIPSIVTQAKKMGIESKLAAVPSLVLGTSDISLYEMVKVYSCFANEGRKPELRSIVKIETASGEVIYEADFNSEMEEVAEAENVKQLNNILHQVNLSGTGRRMYNVYDISKPISGKTGTTQNQSDGWYIGYTPDLVIGAWVGTEDRRIHFRNLSMGAGSNTALPMVGALFEYADYQNMLTRNEYAELGDLEACLYGPRPEEDEDLLEAIEDIFFPETERRKSRGRTGVENRRKRIDDITIEKKKLKQILDELKERRKKKKKRR